MPSIVHSLLLYLQAPSRILQRRVLVIGALVVVAVVVSAARGTSPMFPVSDEAMTEIYTLHALHGNQFTGPYSRFGWHHPGPAYFYFLAPFYVASGRLTAGLNAGALVSNLLTMAITGWALGRRRQYAALTCLAILTALYVGRLDEMVASAWTAHVAVLALVAVTVTAAAVAAGDYALLPVMLAVGSFAVQTHLAVGPAVAVASLVAAGALFARMRTHPEERVTLRRSMAAAAIVVGTLWALPTAEALSNRGGNVAVLLEFFENSDAGVSVLRATMTWADSLTAIARLNLEIPRGQPFRPFGGLLTGALAALEVGVLGGIIISTWRRRQFSFWLASLGLLTSTAALLAVARIPEEIADHQVFWISSLGLVNATVILGFAASKAARWLPALQRWGRPTAVLVSGCALVWLLYSGLGAIADVGRRSRHPVAEERFVRATRTALGDVLAERKVRRVLVHVEPATWHLTAGLVLQLYKAGIPCSVDGGVGMYGRRFRPDGTEDFAIAILPDEDRRRAAITTGRIPIFQRDGFVVEGWPLI